MRNHPEETRNGWRRLFLTAAGVVALAFPVIVGVLIAPRLQAQAPATLGLTSPTADRPPFDVASIKSNKSSDPATFNFPIGAGDAMRPVGGLFSVTNMPLLNIMTFAYKLVGDIQYLMPGLPDWVKSERFDIQARATGTPKMTLQLLASSLVGADNFDRPIVDRTGLTGAFDLWFEWAPRPNGTPPPGFQPDESGPSIQAALQEQLGLKLESQTAPVDVMVVDHIEGPSAN